MQGHHRKDLQPDDVGREKCRRHSKNKPMLNALITALIVINERVYNEKAYVDLEVKELLSFHKVLGTAPRNNENNNNDTSNSSGLDSLPVENF